MIWQTVTLLLLIFFTEMHPRKHCCCNQHTSNKELYPDDTKQVFGIDDINKLNLAKALDRGMKLFPFLKLSVYI